MIGDTIRILRRQRDWTQEELATKIGVHSQHLTRWEKNKVKPRPSTLEKLAKIFEVSIEEFTRHNSNPHLEEAIPDPELLEQFQAAVQLNEEERKAVKTILRAMVTQHRMKNLVNE